MNNLQFPETTQSIHDQLTGFINQLKSHVSEQSAKLDEIESLHTPSSLAGDASSLINLRNELNDLLFSGHAIALTPYQYRIGNNGVLSADTAASFAADKLTEQLDSINASYGLALVITASNESTFAKNVQSITNVLAFPEWLATADKAAQNAVLELNKMQIPQKRLNPYWRNDNYALQKPLFDTEQLLNDEIAQAEAVAESNTKPTDRLKQLAQKQSESLTQLLNSVSTLISLFNGQCYAIKLTGSPANMADQLRDSVTSSEPYSTLFLMASDKEPTFFYEMVDV